MRNTVLHVSFFLFTAITCIASCSKPENNEPATTSPESSIILENSAGDTTSMSYIFENDWSITDVPEWVEIRPRSGTAGEYRLSFKSLLANESAIEREWNGGSGIYVIQRPSPGVYAKSPSQVSATGGTLDIDVRHSIGFDVETQDDWLTASVELSDEKVILGDGKTESFSNKSVLTCTIDENMSGPRTGKILFKSNGATIYEIEINQEGEILPEWDKEFYRNSLFLRFTATWCSYCPWMEEALEDAKEMCPDRIITLCSHPDNSEGGMAWEGTSFFEEFYSVTSYPTGIMNDIARFKNQDVALTSREVAGLAEEAKQSYPSSTCTAISSMVSDNTVNVTLKIASKRQGEYRLFVYVVEDGIVFKQSGTGMDNYVHNSVIRDILTSMDGDIVSFSGPETTSDIQLSASVPESVMNIDNAYIVAYVTVDGFPGAGNVEGVEYEDFGRMVDNVSVCSINGSCSFRYED